MRGSGGYRQSFCQPWGPLPAGGASPKALVCVTWSTYNENETFQCPWLGFSCGLAHLHQLLCLFQQRRRANQHRQRAGRVRSHSATGRRGRTSRRPRKSATAVASPRLPSRRLPMLPCRRSHRRTSRPPSSAKANRPQRRVPTAGHLCCRRHPRRSHPIRDHRGSGSERRGRATDAHRLDRAGNIPTCRPRNLTRPSWWKPPKP